MEFKYLKEQYEVKRRSIGEIADEFGTYPNKVRRILLKGGVVLRDKSEAQKQALENGTALHPTKGKKMSDATKLKVSEKASDVWRNLTPQQLEARKKVLRERWGEKTEEEVKDMQSKAAAAISAAGRDGSKIEKFLVDQLTALGYNVLFHKKGIIPNTELEPDIIVTDYKTVIEIDGPSHFFPIWGQDTLDKKIASDNEKNGLFLLGGFSILRVKHLCKTLTQKKKRDLLKQVVISLEEVNNLTTPKIVEIEV